VLDVLTECKVTVVEDTQVSPDALGGEGGVASKWCESKIEFGIRGIVIAGGFRKVEEFRLCIVTTLTSLTQVATKGKGLRARRE